ncbi:hypothetical protein ACDX78_06365 [Virgibacillus oceani]
MLLNETLFRPENAIMVIGYNDRSFSEAKWPEKKIESVWAAGDLSCVQKKEL